MSAADDIFGPNSSEATTAPKVEGVADSIFSPSGDTNTKALDRPAPGGISKADDIFAAKDTQPDMQPSFAPSAAGTETQDASAQPVQGPSTITSIPQAAAQAAKQTVEAPAVVAGSLAASATTLLAHPIDTVAKALSDGTRNISDAFMMGASAIKQAFSGPPTKPKAEDIFAPQAQPVAVSSPEDEATAHAMQSLDIPRLQKADGVAQDFNFPTAATGPTSVLGKLGGAGMKAVTSLGDFLGINQWLQGAQANVKQFYASDPDYALHGNNDFETMAANIIANAPKEFLAPFATDVAPMLFGDEASLFGLAKLGPKLLTKVLRNVPEPIIADGSEAAYKAAVMLSRDEITKSALQSLAKTKTTGMDAVVTQNVADLLSQAHEASLESWQPSAMTRLAMKAGDVIDSLPGGQFVTGAFKKAQQFARNIRIAVNGDKIECLAPDVQPHVFKMQQAKQFGDGIASMRVGELQQRIFGDALYNVSDEMRNSNNFMGNTRLYLSSVFDRLPPDKAQLLADQFGMPLDQAKQAWQRAVMNVPFAHPRMELVYTEAGRALFHSKTFMGDLVDRVNDLTHENTMRVNPDLVNPIADKGSLSSDLYQDYKKAGGSSDQLTQARLQAWNQAWKEFSSQAPDGTSKLDGFKKYLGDRLYGDQDLVSRVMSTMDEYMKMNRGEIEPFKLRQGADLKGDLYLHHVYNPGNINGPIREAAQLAEVSPGVYKFRSEGDTIGIKTDVAGVPLGPWEGGRKAPLFDAEGKPIANVMAQPREDANFNLREVMHDELSEVYSAAHYNEGLKGLRESSGIRQMIRGTERLNSDTGNLEHLDVSGDHPVWREDKTMKVLPLEHADRNMIKGMLGEQPGAFSDQVALGIQKVLAQASKEGQVLSPDGLVNQALSGDQISKIRAILGQRQLVVRNDVYSYLTSMQKAQDAAMLTFLKRSASAGDTGWERLVRGYQELPMGKATLNASGIINAGIKRMSVNEDVSAFCQRIAGMSRIWQEFSPAAMMQIMNRANKFLNPRDLEMYEMGLRSGFISPRNVGMRETPELGISKTLSQVPVVGQALDRAPIVGPAFRALDRHMAFSEFAAYGPENFTSASYDLRYRLATASWLRDKLLAFHDNMASDMLTKQMYGNFQKFFSGFFGTPDYNGLISPSGKINEVQFGRQIQGIFGSMNYAGRTAFERDVMSKVVPFYGWGRSTFVPIMTAAVRNPLWAAVAPLYLMHKLNYVTSGHTSDQNPEGHQGDIMVDPKRLGIDGPPLFVSPGTVFSKAYSLDDGTRLQHIVNQVGNGQYRDAMTLGIHFATSDLPTNLFNKSVSQVESGRKLLEFVNNEFYDRTHDSEEAAYRQFRNAVATWNFKAAEVMDQMVTNRVRLTPELMFQIMAPAAASVFSGLPINSQVGSERSEFKREEALNPLGMSDPVNRAKAAIEFAIQQAGSKDPAKYVANAMLSAHREAALEDVESDPKKREQMRAIMLHARK